MNKELDSINKIEKNIRFGVYNPLLGRMAENSSVEPYEAKVAYKTLRTSVVEMFNVLCVLINKGTDEKFYPKFNSAVGKRININLLVELRNEYAHEIDNSDFLKDNEIRLAVRKCCDALIPAFESIEPILTKKLQVVPSTEVRKRTSIVSVLKTIKEYIIY